MDSAARDSDPRSMTSEGYERLREELETLCTAGREEVAEWLRTARDGGDDPSENGDIAHALQERERLELRIGQLEAVLAAARVVSPVDDGTVGIGTRVQVRRQDGRVVHYELVGGSEADPLRGRISIASPVGRALAGGARGDVVEVETPGGRRRLELLAVDNAAPPLLAA